MYTTQREGWKFVFYIITLRTGLGGPSITTSPLYTYYTRVPCARSAEKFETTRKLIPSSLSTSQMLLVDIIILLLHDDVRTTRRRKILCLTSYAAPKLNGLFARGAYLQLCDKTDDSSCWFAVPHTFVVVAFSISFKENMNLKKNWLQ